MKNIKMVAFLAVAAGLSVSSRAESLGGFDISVEPGNMDLSAFEDQEYSEKPLEESGWFPWDPTAGEEYSQDNSQGTFSQPENPTEENGQENLYGEERNTDISAFTWPVNETEQTQNEDQWLQEPDSWPSDSEPWNTDAWNTQDWIQSQDLRTPDEWNYASYTSEESDSRSGLEDTGTGETEQRPQAGSVLPAEQITETAGTERVGEIYDDSEVNGMFRLNGNEAYGTEQADRPD